MKKIKDVTKDMILAGLGSIDEQNEEIKDLLRRGSAIFGMGEVDNEELLYNGNRERIMAERLAGEQDDKTYDLGNGRTLYYNHVKDDDGKTLEREIVIDKKKSEKPEKNIDIEASKTPDESRFSFKEVNQTEENKKEGAD
ncbi:MAG: hypothetical protein K5776_03865 [Lachnospiraceae bacterium]|nr:hypothetical protein [Lachnospiraceae bacterium]